MKLNRRSFALSTSALAAHTAWSKQPKRPPNIIYILADDLGYGDLRCLNPAGKIPTPHLDQLCAEGMHFTDAHSFSAVCTPSRYSILTGRYSPRSRKKRSVIDGLGAPLIQPERMTVASLLKEHGYNTACIGKWHIGKNWPLKGGGFSASKKDAPKLDLTQPIQNGPTTLGFDYFYGISASAGMLPHAFIENDRIIGGPIVERKPEGTKRKGPGTPEYEIVDLLPAFTQKTISTIREQAANKCPFFIYFSLNSPHAPIAPSQQFKGKSGLNEYADFVMQTDWAIGQVMAALKSLGIDRNTLVVFTSDNGCSRRADFETLAKAGHNPNYQFRGSKSDIFEGGHRVPFIVRWPGTIQPGSRSDALVCQTDLLATCAELLGTQLPDNAGEDSLSMLPVLLGQKKAYRNDIVHHSIDGSFAIRRGDWKLILCPGSGGWGHPTLKHPEIDQMPRHQLYNLKEDIGEQNNLQAEYPEMVRELTTLLEKQMSAGRSTPGAPQPNEGPIDIWYGLNNRKK